MRRGVHFPAVSPEAVHQRAVVLFLARTMDVEKVRHGGGQRPIEDVDPTGLPGHRAVLLPDTTARGGYADAPPPRGRFEPCRIEIARADVRFDGDRRLTPRGFPPASWVAMVNLRSRQRAPNSPNRSIEPTGGRADY